MPRTFVKPSLSLSNRPRDVNSTSGGQTSARVVPAPSAGGSRAPQNVATSSAAAIVPDSRAERPLDSECETWQSRRDARPVPNSLPSTPDTSAFALPDQDEQFDTSSRSTFDLSSAGVLPFTNALNARDSALSAASTFEGAGFGHLHHLREYLPTPDEYGLGSSAYPVPASPISVSEATARGAEAIEHIIGGTRFVDLLMESPVSETASLMMDHRTRVGKMFEKIHGYPPSPEELRRLADPARGLLATPTTKRPLVLDIPNATDSPPPSTPPRALPDRQSFETDESDGNARYHTPPSAGSGPLSAEQPDNGFPSPPYAHRVSTATHSPPFHDHRHELNPRRAKHASTMGMFGSPPRRERVSDSDNYSSTFVNDNALSFNAVGLGLHDGDDIEDQLPSKFSNETQEGDNLGGSYSNSAPPRLKIPSDRATGSGSPTPVSATQSNPPTAKAKLSLGAHISNWTRRLAVQNPSLTLGKQEEKSKNGSKAKKGKGHELDPFFTDMQPSELANWLTNPRDTAVHRPLRMSRSTGDVRPQHQGSSQFPQDDAYHSPVKHANEGLISLDQIDLDEVFDFEAWLETPFMDAFFSRPSKSSSAFVPGCDGSPPGHSFNGKRTCQCPTSSKLNLEHEYRSLAEERAHRTDFLKYVFAHFCFLAKIPLPKRLEHPNASAREGLRH